MIRPAITVLPVTSATIWDQIFSILKCPKTSLIRHVESKTFHLVPWYDLMAQKQLILANQTTKRDLWERFSLARPHTHRR